MHPGIQHGSNPHGNAMMRHPGFTISERREQQCGADCSIFPLAISPRSRRRWKTANTLPVKIPALLQPLQIVEITVEVFACGFVADDLAAAIPDDDQVPAVFLPPVFSV